MKIIKGQFLYCPFIIGIQFLFHQHHFSGLCKSLTLCFDKIYTTDCPIRYIPSELYRLQPVNHMILEGEVSRIKRIGIDITEAGY